MGSNKTEGTEGQELHDLIIKKDWDGALALIDPSQYEDEQEVTKKVLKTLSPLILMLKSSDGFSRELFLKLVDIGGETLVNFHNGDGTALHHACSLDDAEIIDLFRRLIEVGGKNLVLMTEKYDEQTALHRARNAEEAKLLIEVGEKELVMMQDIDGRTALHTILDCLSPEYMDVFRLLLDVGGEELVLMTDRDGKTALFHAFSCMNDNDFHRQLVHDILEVGGKKVALLPDRDGSTVLHNACCNWVSYPESVSLLLEVAGKTLTMMTDREGKTALHCDMQNAGTHVLHLLETGGEKLALMTDRDGRTALHAACDWERDLPTEAYRQLIEVGGEELLLKADRYGSTVLHLASSWMWKKYPEIYQQMFEIGKEKLTFMTDESGRTALHELCNNATTSTLYPEAVQIFLDFCGEELLLKADNFGSTALHYVCRLYNSRSLQDESVSSNSSDDSSNEESGRKCLFYKIETVNRMVDVGRMKLLLIRDNACETAMEMELQQDDPSEEIIDRFLEIVGRDILLDKIQA